MYYVLDEIPLGSTERLAVIDSYPDIDELDGWMLGTRFTATIPVPLEITLDDSEPGRLPDYFKGTIPLMSDGLITALREVGVDNLDTYEVELKYGSGTVVAQSYKAVNVIGVVSAADMGASVVAPGMPAG